MKKSKYLSGRGQEVEYHYMLRCRVGFVLSKNESPELGAGVSAESLHQDSANSSCCISLLPTS